MKTRRGNPALLLIVLGLALLATLLLAFLPSRDAGEVKTYVMLQMVATMDGLMHRCGMPQELTANLASHIPWTWLGMLGAAAATFAVLQQRGRRS